MMGEKDTTACPHLRCREKEDIHMHDKMSHSAPEEMTTVDTGLPGCALGPIVVSTEERGHKFCFLALPRLSWKEADQGLQRAFSILFDLWSYPCAIKNLSN